MVQRSGRFKTAHTGCHLSAKAYGSNVFDLFWGGGGVYHTTLYGALFGGQSKKRYLRALFSSEFLRRSLFDLTFLWDQY
jgi:hypothetical protein